MLFYSCRKRVDAETVKKWTENNRFSHTLEFDALVDKYNSDFFSISRERVFGADYTKGAVNTISDSALLIVGHDANYLLTLRDVKFYKNELDLDSLSLLYLRIHSPAQTFHSPYIEEAKKYHFKMHFSVSKDNIYSFYLLKANVIK